MTKSNLLPILLTTATASLMCALPADARKRQAAPPVTLTESGEKLLGNYEARMEALKTDIISALPELGTAKKQAYDRAKKAEEAAEQALAEVRKGQAEIKKGHGLVAHAKGKWIGGAEKAIKAAKAELKNAKTGEERTAAETKLAEAEKGKQAGLEALKERQANLDAALKKYANIEEDLKKAEAALEKAKAHTVQAVKDMGISSVLGSDKLDAKLAAYSIMAHATPRGLAAFAQQGPEHAKLIDKLFSDDALMVQMAVADGASGGKYGRAMEIYTAIQKASPKASEGTLQQLAVAVALQHAEPIKQRNAVAETDAPETVDPINRYLAYEKAFLGKELDPCFDDLSTFDLRFVVNGEEPDKISAWGRKMLANYRPDQVTKDDYRWRYVELVRSDIRYGSQDNKFDQDDLQFFQNILKNGGICGRRAFIGRFILRAFGVPTVARPQPGHAALAHWTPDGWVVCLGAGWGAGTTKLGYKKDLDFLATTQARATGDAYLQVKRAHWIGTVMGEKHVFGFLSTKEPAAFWNAIALYTQRDLIEQSKAKTLAAVGEDIGEANVTKEKVEIIQVNLSEDDRKVSVAEDGVITIPAAATTDPTKSSGKIIFMPSNQGGLQMHYSRNGGTKPFTYTVDAAKAGAYALTAKLCTPSWKQNLVIDVNGSSAATMKLPHTVGLWGTTEPVTVELKQGTNTLKFTHETDGYEKGFSIHEFKLVPLK